MKTQRPILLTLAVLGAALPAFANITYTCAANIDPTFCANMLNGPQVSGVYSGIFANMTANIFIQFGNAGVGESSTNLTAIPYADYYNALAAHTDDLTALATLSSASMGPLLPFGNDNGDIDITAALASALGVTESGAQTAGISSIDGVSSCILGVDANCFNGVITMAISPNFSFPTSPGDPIPPAQMDDVDFYMVVEHETDEILGTISCIGTGFDATTSTNIPVDQCSTAGDASPADLFRYAAPGVRSFLTTANGTPAYFSNNGGNTDIADYDNSPDGEDYGDWTTACGVAIRVQNGSACPGANSDLTNDGGSEIAVLDAVGFNLESSVPEPGTMGLLGASLLTLALVHALRRT
jgi:PEP-CTERM motif